MSETIDRYIKEGNTIEALFQCLHEQQYYLGILLIRIFQSNKDAICFDPSFGRICVLLHDATSSETMAKDGEEIQVLENVMISDPQIPTVEKPEEKILEESVPVVPVVSANKTRVLLYCNWCSSEELCQLWNKMSQGNYTWNNIQIVWDEPCDLYVVINCPPITIFPDTRKTILFQMEPNMAQNKHMWGDWGDPPKDSFKYCGTHAVGYNNNEWHLSKSYTELSMEKIRKNEDIAQILSTVLSDKYNDPGHIKRVDFIKFLESKGMNVHVYGGNKFVWKNYKGSLPPHQKDDAMFPYKYVFNAENHEQRNYFTEKLIDGILAECLVFYWGCPNIRDFFDEHALVKLELDNFEKDYETIRRAIDENWWEQRLPYIRQAKQQILNHYQFFPRLERILNE